MIRDGASIKVLDLKDHNVVYQDSEETKVETEPDRTNNDIAKEGSVSLINRKMFKNVEDFDVYESLIQGESLYKTPFLVNASGRDNDNTFTFDINFDRPTSLFCLGLELYFDADVAKLKAISGHSSPSDDTKIYSNSDAKEDDSQGIDNHIVDFGDAKTVNNVELDKNDSK